MNLESEENHPVSRMIRGDRVLKLIKGLNIKERKIEIKKEEESRREILENISQARSQWIRANQNFEHAQESDMVDYFVYEIKACQVRYEYLLKKAKESGIKASLPGMDL